MAEATGQEVCKIKYIYTEMTLNKENKYDTVTGLFMGIVNRNNEKFVLIQGAKDTVAVLNTKFYGIVTVETLKDDYREMLYLKCSEDDQKVGLQLLEELYALLLANDFGMKNDAKILDIEKYKGVPEQYKNPVVDYSAPVSGATSTAGPSYQTGAASKTPAYNTYAGNTTYYTTVAKKDPQPALLGRTKTKKPTKAELDLMQEKIDQIKAGTFTSELPETLGDVVATETDTKKDAAGRAVNYYNGADDEYFGM